MSDRCDNQQSFADTQELRPADAESTCLRPLGLCELGGCCDVCWYRPDHPRFKADAERGHDPGGPGNTLAAKP